MSNLNYREFFWNKTVDPFWNWLAHIAQMDGIKLAIIAYFIVKDSQTNADIPPPPHPFDEKSLVQAGVSHRHEVAQRLVEKAQGCQINPVV